MSKRTVTEETEVEITEEEYLQLEGLKALYEKVSEERERIMEAFADIVNLNDNEYHYDRGAYILQDNEGTGYHLRAKLEGVGITIIKSKNKDDDK